MKIEIKRIKSIPHEKITNFLKKIYSNRGFKIHKIWNWLYQTDKNHNATSLVALKNDDIIAHAGLIPFFINLRGRKRKAGWFVDFIVDEKFQRHGIGKILTKKWLNFYDVGLTFCNNKSFGIFQKFGWKTNFKFNLHYFLIKPFNHQKIYLKLKYIKFILYFLNAIYQFIFINKIKLNIDKNHEIKIEKINIKNIDNFLDINLKKNLINTYRDSEYLVWRFIKSPELDNYLQISYKNTYYAIVKKRTEKKFNHYLDLLLINKYNESNEFVEFLLNIIIWASDNDLSYLKMMIPDKKISNFIKKNIFTIITKPRFAFFSKNEKEMNEIKNSNINFQLFDTDFEFTD
tara:strand:+ start:453 stop:1487 length:1035 start_codon:yes stop_codon:yes gene_type:complete